PTDASQIWSDITSFDDGRAMTREIGIRHSRQNELGRVDPAPSDLLVSNRDSRFNHENPSSPYYPHVLPKRQVRVLARSGATARTLFTGFTSGFPQEWPHVGFDAVVRIQAVDLMGVLARSTFSSGARERTWFASGVLDLTQTTT